jgi:uncharacterized repeat protein (TIGR03803 family)
VVYEIISGRCAISEQRAGVFLTADERTFRVRGAAHRPILHQEKSSCRKEYFMHRTKFLPILIVVMALLIVPLTWVSSASAQGGTGRFKVLYSFTAQSDGWAPHGGVVSDATGNLYGITFFSGDHGCGAAFKLTPTPDGSWNLSVIHSFEGAATEDGCNPSARLVFDTTGNLYGTTEWGGSHDLGTVFKLTPN